MKCEQIINPRGEKKITRKDESKERQREGERKWPEETKEGSEREREREKSLQRIETGMGQNAATSGSQEVFFLQEFCVHCCLSVAHSLSLSLSLFFQLFKEKKEGEKK